MAKIKNFKLGASGNYPYGKVDKDDEGELNLAIAADKQHRIIRIVFGKPVAWIGIPVGHAKELIKILTEKIKELEKEGN
jgi:hypothetical protein